MEHSEFAYYPQADSRARASMRHPYPNIRHLPVGWLQQLKDGAEVPYQTEVWVPIRTTV